MSCQHNNGGKFVLFHVPLGQRTITSCIDMYQWNPSSLVDERANLSHWCKGNLCGLPMDLSLEAHQAHSTSMAFNIPQMTTI
jgi:hypothetical protein